MMHLYFRGNIKIHKFISTQLNKFFSTKKSKDKDNIVGQNIHFELESPNDKILKCLRKDVATMKKYLSFWKDYKNVSVDETGKVLNWDHPDAPIFPSHCDILIIGGGAIGSSIAYWCQRLCKDFRVVVIERDPTYQKSSTVLSVGGLRQQFSLEENIKMSIFGAEFLRNINNYLGIEGEPPIDVQFHPYGYLSLATEKTAQTLIDNSVFQNYLGARNIVLTANQLKYKFPWICTDGIELGCLGLENEGWFDPWSLLIAFKKKAISLGANYVTAEAKGFHFTKNYESQSEEPLENLEYLIVQTDDGKMRPIKFSKCIIAAGAFSAEIARMAKIGCGKDLLSIPLPVEPRKRFVYYFHAPNGPGLNTPLTIDPSGTYFRREGLGNHYICGRSPEEDEEPSIENLDVDSDYFNNRVWPILAKRVKEFENLKVKSSWAGYYEYNTFDENGILGYHPYYKEIIFATGFSGHGIQKSPAVGRAVSELIENRCYSEIDLSRLDFERFIEFKPLKEKNIW